MKGFLTVIWVAVLSPFIVIGFFWGFAKMGIDVGVNIANRVDDAIAKITEWD